MRILYRIFQLQMKLKLNPGVQRCGLKIFALRAEKLCNFARNVLPVRFPKIKIGCIVFISLNTESRVRQEPRFILLQELFKRAVF